MVRSVRRRVKQKKNKKQTTECIEADCRDSAAGASICIKVDAEEVAEEVEEEEEREENGDDMAEDSTPESMQSAVATELTSSRSFKTKKTDCEQQNKQRKGKQTGEHTMLPLRKSVLMKWRAD